MQLAFALRRDGDVDGELRELRLAAELQHDASQAALVDKAQHVFAAWGATAMRRTMAEEQVASLARGQGSAFAAATSASDLRRRADTLHYLSLAKAAHDPSVMSLRTNSDFAWLRREPKFQALAP